ncbi:MAG: CDP-alcohol phosphatidyltransferase family protein [Rhodospirillaceae bacterium]|jgi:phosphatidylglycerophosphate synthase|nr:CDP-alcohol phosphatidyltransferase family protein [Rhodospirillaceae bacterium]
MTEKAPGQLVPYDQAICAILVRPLINTPVTPNHITTLSLILGLAASVLFAWGEGSAPLWAAGLVTIARFIDHMDGELARQSGKTSPIGAMYDSLTGTACYGTMFLGMGYAEWRNGAGDWALFLAGGAMVFIVINMMLQFRVETWTGVAPDPYPQIGRIEAEDGIYLILPIIWLTGTWGFFVAGTIGTLIFTIINISDLMRRLREPKG